MWIYIVPSRETSKALRHANNTMISSTPYAFTRWRHH